MHLNNMEDSEQHNDLKGFQMNFVPTKLWKPEKFNVISQLMSKKMADLS